MLNSFPGMNPYLEAATRWTNVRGRLIAILMDELDTCLPPGYSVNMEAHSHSEEPRETYINIVDVEQGNRVVTSIELLSPINKAPGAGQEAYLTKQQEMLNSATHRIEIDLLRAGTTTVAIGRPVLPETGRYDYLICLHRGGQGEQFEIWPRSVRQRLPHIVVPLAANDPDVLLDLQAAVDRCYDRGRFAQKINYTQPPNPPLSEEDAAWADALLREKGLRS